MKGTRKGAGKWVGVKEARSSAALPASDSLAFKRVLVVYEKIWS